TRAPRPRPPTPPPPPRSTPPPASTRSTSLTPASRTTSTRLSIRCAPRTTLVDVGEACLRVMARPISVPVKAYTATDSSGEVHLNQLHRDCNARIQYKKTCPIHGEVFNDQIVSGYEYAKDQYVPILPEELDKLRTESDKAINIDSSWTRT